MINDFSNITSIKPEYWGKNGWIFINSIALTYNPEYKENYKQFILQLPYILPCKTCGNNLKKNIETIDNALQDKQTFIDWLLKIRNDIYTENNEIHKHKNINNILDEIFNKHPNNTNIFQIILIVIIIILLISLLILMTKPQNKFSR